MVSLLQPFMVLKKGMLQVCFTTTAVSMANNLNFLANVFIFDFSMAHVCKLVCTKSELVLCIVDCSENYSFCSSFQSFVLTDCSVLEECIC